MFRVVTVERELGSGGGVIAQSVAEQLGWKLLDRKLIAAVAQTAQVKLETAFRFDESIDSWWHRFNRGGLWAAAVEAGARPDDVQFFDSATMASFAHELIARAGAEGHCVIVGRGAQCVLQDSPEALHVFVFAPWAERVRRVQRRVGRNEDAADLVRLTDGIRAQYIRRHFGCDWKDPHLYHMMINSQLGDENVARQIIGAIETRETTTLVRSA
ncbi:MAG TPA: cytidylate kinase-like family protein [Terriglobia bacterium]|nr:cytidylate kinase-like family protein [Terriglobia bacterium]